ncbi:MAG: SUMF1/EgtB/PvdO family nonheme iron enzyme [Rhodospirillaceae bacterium]|nr:SUMF1/EgtB/PvdO family nonheme iron enzyme [Rhodospirillaceae bacterium]
MTHTRASVAFLSVCLWALFLPLSASGAQGRPASLDGFHAAAPATVQSPEPLVRADDFSDPLASGGEGPVMAVVPAGTFRMGCLQVSGCDDDELPVREVAIPMRFALSKHEITFADWDACVEAGGCGGYLPDDEGWGRESRPVIHVSWDDAQSYVTWLSESTGEVYRLPSEAEWEYAARAGTETRFGWGDGLGPENANCREERCRDGHRNTAPTGSFPANAWGLHDMHGNVFEWVEDCWAGGTYEGAPSDGSARVDGDCTRRVIRGGAWTSSPTNLRSANRIRNARGDRRDDLGFRVVRALPPADAGVVPLFPPAADAAPQGFVRVINHSEVAGQVRIDAFDDNGMAYGPVMLSIGPGDTVHFNSEDLELGNAAKGLPDGIGSGPGDWRLQLSTILNVEILSYIRTPDGFLTEMRQTVPANEGSHRVSFFNPGRNHDQVSHLRLINPGAEESEITITGVDDTGRRRGTASLSLAAGQSRTFSSQELQAGRGELDGELGTGLGKWHLTVVPSAPIIVMNLLKSPSGHLANLSATPVVAHEGEHFVPLFPPKSSLGREGFLRVINLSDASGEVLIYAVDDDDDRQGLVSLTLEAGAAAHLNSTDLEDGNTDKGLFGSTGAGTGDWRLELTSALEIEALAYVRTDDGFVTAIHDVAPHQGIHHRIAVFNPGSNTEQASHLRLVNPTDEPAQISIRGIDDAGRPGGRVELTVPAGQSRTYSASHLESGGGDLQGSLGDGVGKWQLEVASEQNIVAMSLLESPTGHLTNLSDAKFRRLRLATARDVFAERISGPVAQSSCVECHVAGGEAEATRLTLLPDTADDHASLNREAFADFVAEVEAGENLILAKMRGDADHGGGVQVAEDSAEYADMVRFLRLVVAESSALFDSITYAGSATLGNGERMAAQDLLIEVPERTLLDDIAMSVNETVLPAALPPGVRQIADAVEIAIGDEVQQYMNGPLTVTMTLPEDTREDGDLVVLHYEPDLERWFGATMKSHDPGSRRVAFESRVFGAFVVGRATSPLPGAFNTGFDPAAHGFRVENEEVEYHTRGGNAFGMAAFAIYHFNFAENKLNDLWSRNVQRVVATLVQSTTPPMYLDSGWWRSFRFDPSATRRTIHITRTPVVLMLTRLDGRHAVVAYGYDGDEFLVYDPNYPDQAGRTTGGGKNYASGNRLYTVSHAVQLGSVGRIQDFERLEEAAGAGFPDSDLLNVDVLDGQEVHGRRLGFSGDLNGVLTYENVRLSLYDGRYPYLVARNPDASFDGSLNVRYGANAYAFLAGRSAAPKNALQSKPLGGRYWEAPSAALIRRVTGVTDKAALRMTIGWKAPSDMDLLVQEPGNGEVLFWGNRATVNALTLDEDNRGLDAGDFEYTETVLLLEPREPLAGEYRVFLHQYDDYGLNDRVDVTVDVELYEGHGSRNVPFLHGSTVHKGQFGLDGATTVAELLNGSAVEVARVDPDLGQICFFDPASGRFDECADRTKPALGPPEPVTAPNGEMASEKPDSGGPPALRPGSDLEISIDSDALPASDCTFESPWRACYHTRSAVAGDLVEVKVEMPQAPAGVWHGAWCAKATSEGLCGGRHDNTDRLEKRFAGNATLSFVTRAPRDATSFWIVGEVRECEKPICYWPADYAEVEFHHIEVDVQANPAGAGDASLFWLDGGLVRQSDLEGTSIRNVIDFGRDVGQDLAIDLAGGKAYVIDADSGTIRRANLDGSSIETVVTGLQRADGIALDGEGKMYYAAEGIHRANLDGSNRETLIGSLPWPQDIALDTAGSMMYWVDHAAGRIQRARLDGSGLQDLVARGLRLPEGIALDLAGGRMYWTDRDTGKVLRSNLDGIGIRELVTSLNGPHSIAFHAAERMLYWTELGTDRIRHANADGRGIEVVVDGVRRGGPTGLVIVAPD